jgi:hypothetical protein
MRQNSFEESVGGLWISLYVLLLHHAHFWEEKWGNTVQNVQGSRNNVLCVYDVAGAIFGVIYMEKVIKNHGTYKGQNPGVLDKGGGEGGGFRHVVNMVSKKR